MVAQQLGLHLRGQAGGDAVRIDRVIVQSFRLQEDVVAVPVREPHDLVLDRGTIARPRSRDVPAIHRRAVQIGPDHRMRRRRGRGDPAFDLRIGDPFGQRAEWLGHGIAWIRGQGRPSRSCADPAAAACRSSSRPSGRLEPRQRLCQTDRGRLPYPPGRVLLLADMDHAAQKRPGRQHRRAAADQRSPSAHSTPASRPSAPISQILDCAGAHRQPGVSASNRCIARRYNARSACARGPRTAGPLLRFSSLK